MKRIYRYILIFCVILLSFYLFSRQIKNGFLKQVDFTVTVKLQERIDKSTKLRLAALVGEVMEGATFFASPEFSVVVVGILGLLSLYDWKRKRIRWSGLIISLCFGLLILGEIYGKNVVHHPAPPFFMIKNPTTIFPKDYINSQYSYPSGHAARAIFISIILFLSIQLYRRITMKKKVLIVFGLGVYIGIVSVSRIYLGHHWLSDVIGGLLLGSSFGLLSYGIIDTS